MFWQAPIKLQPLCGKFEKKKSFFHTVCILKSDFLCGFSIENLAEV